MNQAYGEAHTWAEGSKQASYEPLSDGSGKRGQKEGELGEKAAKSGLNCLNAPHSGLTTGTKRVKSQLWEEKLSEITLRCRDMLLLGGQVFFFYCILRKHRSKQTR